MPPKIVFLLFLYCSCLCLQAQSTFIKRYKNTTQPEGSSAVCNLPGNRIAIAGNQSLWGTYYVPMIIITDSAGNQLRHFVDTSCYECSVRDIASDSAGFIYIAGKFLNKAGIAKYDTMGNKIWQRQLSTNGGESGFNRLTISSDELIVAGGFQIHYPMVVGWTLIAAYNINGDTLWTMDSNHGYLWQNTRFDILGVTVDSSNVYATGYVSDTIPQRIIFIRINKAGQVLTFKELNNGRKWGYDIIPISPDSILIGGIAVNANLKLYSFLSMVDSVGNIAYTIQDSNYLYSTITKMDYDEGAKTLYTLGSDTLFDAQFGFSSHYHVEAHNFPVANLQQPLWEKTVKGTTITGTYTGLRKAPDGTLLHTGPDNDNCHCSYLLKSDANTCADLTTCDTAFQSSVLTLNKNNFHLKIYPNPLAGSVAAYELSTDIPIHTIEITVNDITGRAFSFYSETLSDNEYSHRGRLTFTDETANGIYVLQFRLNQQYSVFGRIIKMK